LSIKLKYISLNLVKINLYIYGNSSAVGRKESHCNATSSIMEKTPDELIKLYAKDTEYHFCRRLIGSI